MIKKKNRIRRKKNFSFKGVFIILISLLILCIILLYFYMEFFSGLFLKSESQLDGALATIGIFTGEGSLENPYEISNCQELQNIQTDLNSNYKLINDIDCSDSRNWNEGLGFEPLGESDFNFIGVFDGDNYEVRNLYINNINKFNVGLFGVIGEGGIIKNTDLVNPIIFGANFVGGLAGINKGKIINSEVKNIQIYEPDLLAHYSLEENANDGSGRDNHGIFSGNSNFINGKIGFANDFNGDNSKIEIDSEDFDLVDDFTISAWVKPHSSETCYIVGHNYQWILKLSEGNRLGLDFLEESGSNWHNPYIYQPYTDEWFHITASYKQGVGVKIYYNGVWDDVANNEYTGLIRHNNGKTKIGVYFNNNHYCDGSIDEIKVWGRALSDEEVKQEYNRIFYRNVNLGGVVGMNQGEINLVSSSGKIIGESFVGGLVGKNNGKILNSFSEADIKGVNLNSVNKYFGGLIGELDGGIVNDCYSKGKVVGGESVGGLIGIINEGSLTNSYSLSEVSGNINVGGLIGSSGDYSNSYYDSDNLICIGCDNFFGAENWENLVNVSWLKNHSWRFPPWGEVNNLVDYPILSGELGNSLVVLSSPVSGGVYIGSSYLIRFKFNVDESFQADNCFVSASGVEYGRISEVSSGENQIVVTFPLGSYEAFISCEDSSQNIENSNKINFVIQGGGGGGGDGGGGGGGGILSSFWLDTISLNENQFSEGYSLNLSERERVKFLFEGLETFAGVISSTGSVTLLNFSAIDEEVLFFPGDEKRFDFNLDGYYDIYIKLNSINVKESFITLRKIHEVVLETDESEIPIPAKVLPQGSYIETPAKSNIVFYILVAFIIILIIGIFILLIYFVILKLGYKKELKH